MDSFYLSDNEISSINDFINELEDNIIVLSVFIVAYQYYNNSRKCYINIITDLNSYYTVHNKKPVVKSTKYNKLLKNSITKLNQNLDNSRIEVITTPIIKFDYGLMHEIERKNARELQSGTIIFDRDNTMESFAEDTSKYVDPYPNALNIDGIDKIKKQMIKKRSK